MEECVVLNLKVDVVPDFYVNSPVDTTVQGGVIEIIFDSIITNAENYTIEVKGPFVIANVEPVIDYENKIVIVNWGEAPDFIGKDSVTYEICTDKKLQIWRVYFSSKVNFRSFSRTKWRSWSRGV